MTCRIHIPWVAAAVLAATLCLASCREGADYIPSYGTNDRLNFLGADTCYVEQFKALWTALNCNYGIWDHEADFGLDWDDVYDEYLPVMEELDKRDKEADPVQDDELLDIYKKILGPLHDGHLMVEVRNLHTGGRIHVTPGKLRNESRPDIGIAGPVPMDFYLTEAAGQNQVADHDFVQVNGAGWIVPQFNQALATIQEEIGKLRAVDRRTDLQTYLLNNYLQAYEDFTNWYTNDRTFSYYNNVLCSKYAYLGIVMQPFDIADPNLMISVKYALFKDGIAYLGFSGFMLGNYIKKAPEGNCAAYFAPLVAGAWGKWYEAIQTLHEAGRLKGVVIDVRGNPGGMTADYDLVLGALLPGGGHELAYNRSKVGVGRYDYSALVPLRMATRGEEHAVVTEPIVVLSNANTVSMAEVTCLGAKALENGTVIGTRTWGGMCLLASDPSAYSINYASCVGVSGVTSFYAYIPTVVTVSPQDGILEGIGVTPDIEVDLDVDLIRSTGRDTQLERALEFIRTGQ